MKKWKDFFNKFGTFKDFSKVADVHLGTVKNWSRYNHIPPSKHPKMIAIAESKGIKLSDGIIKRMEKSK